MPRIAQCAALAALLAGSLAVGEGPGPVSRPATDTRLARQFLSVAHTAWRRGKAEKAEEALRKAVRYDPGLVEAIYLLGRACQEAGRAHEAAERYRQVVKLVASRAKATRDETRWALDAKARLDRATGCVRRWAKLRAEFARRFRGLAGGRGGLPSCVRALAVAAALAPSDEGVSAELAAARKLLAGALPPPPEKPDPEGARLLLDQAEKLNARGNTTEVIKLLRAACAAHREVSALVVLAELELAARRPFEAAAAASAAAALLVDVPAQRVVTLSDRAQKVLEQADPNAARVDALTTQFASAAEALAGRARTGNDLDTAEAIEALLDELLPGRGADDEKSPRQRRRPDRPDLAGETVRFRIPRRARLKRTSRTLELRCVRSDGSRDGEQAIVALGRFVGGRVVRATWRVQQIAPSPEKAGAVAIGFLPDPDVRVWARRSKRAVDLERAGRHSILATADHETREDMYRESGGYTVAFEKAGPDVTIRVGGEELARFRMPSRLQREAAKRPLTLFLAVDGRKDTPVAVRATLVRFSCSPDCIRQAPRADGPEGR